MVRELFGCFLAYLWKVKSNTVIPYTETSFMNMDDQSNKKTEGVLETIVLVICFLLSSKSFWIVLSIVSLSLHWDYLRYVFYHRRCYCNQRWMLKSLCGSIKTSIKLNKIHIFKVCDPCLIPKSKLKKHSVVMLLLQRIHFTKNPNNVFSQRNVLRILYSLLKAKTIVATLRGGLGCVWPASFK